MKRVGIVGYGIVGSATLHSLGKNRDDASFRVYDCPKKLGSLQDVAGCDYVFVCLPTPSSSKGADTSIVEGCIDDLVSVGKKESIIIIRSTVPPGTTKKVAKKYPEHYFAMIPEFLREKTAKKDAANPDRIVIGADDPLIHERILRLYEPLYPLKTRENPCGVPYFLTDTKTAEMIKYAGNAYRACKVIFANRIKEFCDKAGISYDGFGGVKEVMQADPVIGSSHLGVTLEKGFGGKCLPKDLLGLIASCKEYEVDPSLFELVWEINLKIRKPEFWDWLTIPGSFKEEKKADQEVVPV